MKILKDRTGGFMIYTVVLTIVLLTIAAAGFEDARLKIIARGTRDAMQAALTQVCTDNASPVYTGVRDGYSGGYKMESTNWTPDVTSGDILSKVDAKLGTSGGVKTTDGKNEYQISDLSVTMKNAPLAPSDPDSTEQLTGTATYTLTVPLSFGWSSLPPMTIHMEAKSGYSQQGDLRGSDDSGGDGGTQVTGVSLSESAMTLCKGDTDVLAASVLPDDAADRTISWASANSAVCSVTQSGVITGVNKGKTSVLAISGSGKMAQCDVTVVAPVTGVSLDKSNIAMIPGATENLTATVLPSDATNRGVSWVSSDPSVCTVDPSGKVTATGAGQSTITVMTQEGGYYAECVVKVTIPVTGITMDKTALAIAKGATDTLTAKVWPGNATRQDVLWASSDSSVCTVDLSGHIVAIGVGSAVISATSEDGQYVATCTINVVIPVTGVSVSPVTLELIKGTTGTATATISPSDATDQTVFWSSSDSDIASVDSSGKISANNAGTATITAKTEDGGYTASCAVTVKPNTYTVTAIAGDGGSVSGGGVYQAGSDVTLTATPDAHYHFVHWTNSGGTVIGTSKTYTISNLSADTTVHATFAIDTFTVTVNASTGGTATGGGTYPYGKVITLTATPDEGYKFLDWSDGDLSNPRSYTVTEDVTLTAEFVLKPVTWTESLSYETSKYYCSKGACVNTYGNSSLYAGVDACDNAGGDGRLTNINGVYTFSSPLLMKAGSTISGKISIDGHAYNIACSFASISHDNIKIQDSSLSATILSDNDVTAFSYTFTSDTSINTISLDSGMLTAYSHKDWYNVYGEGYVTITVSPVGRPSFVLNGTNTS